VLALLAAFLCGAMASDGLSPGEARRLIATMGGMNLPKEAVHIRRIDTLGGQATVEALVQTGFEFTKRDGRWEVTGVRVGDRQWESVELVTAAVRAEKIRRTTEDVREVAAALEAFRRERGFLPQAKDFAALIDFLTPHYLPRVIREDYWHRSFVYSMTPHGYRIESLGPDGKPATGDEIVMENGQLISSRPKGGHE